MAITIVNFLLTNFLRWLGLFLSPAHNFELLWLTIPIYLNWGFTEFYQEKKGTSLGNAISNGIIALWVGMDWGKTTYVMLKAGTVNLNSIFWSKMGFSALMIVYGIAIIILGIKVKKATHYIGKIRVVTYVSLMFTPIFYDVVKADWTLIFGIVLFFPIFYFFVELLDWIVPDPAVIKEDEKSEPTGSNRSPDPFANLNSNSGRALKNAGTNNFGRPHTTNTNLHHHNRIQRS